MKETFRSYPPPFRDRLCLIEVLLCIAVTFLHHAGGTRLAGDSVLPLHGRQSDDSFLPLPEPAMLIQLISYSFDPSISFHVDQI